MSTCIAWTLPSPGSGCVLTGAGADWLHWLRQVHSRCGYPAVAIDSASKAACCKVLWRQYTVCDQHLNSCVIVVCWLPKTFVCLAGVGALFPSQLTTRLQEHTCYTKAGNRCNLSSCLALLLCVQCPSLCWNRPSLRGVAGR
jgi:hypothetical protein